MVESRSVLGGKKTSTARKNLISFDVTASGKRSLQLAVVLIKTDSYFINLMCLSNSLQKLPFLLLLSRHKCSDLGVQEPKDGAVHINSEGMAILTSKVHLLFLPLLGEN